MATETIVLTAFEKRLLQTLGEKRMTKFRLEDKLPLLPDEWNAAFGRIGHLVNRGRKMGKTILSLNEAGLSVLRQLDLTKEIDQNRKLN